MKLYKRPFSIALLLTLSIGITFISCSTKQKEKTAETTQDEKHEAGEHEAGEHEGAAHEKGEHAEGHSDVLELTAQQIKAVDIRIGSIEQKNLTEVVKASGQLAVPPQNEAKINVLSGGIIRKINVLEGQKVHKGQVLAILENQDMIKLQQEYLAAKNGFSYVGAEYDRQQQLKVAGAGTGKSFQLAEANYNAERSRIKALERQLQQLSISATKVAAGNITSQIPITAPIAGTIGTISVTTGSYIQPGTSLMDIVDNSKIHADLLVYEKDLFKVKIGQKVSFRLTNQENQQIEGVLNGINKSFEDDTKGVIVHAVITKPLSNLIPGMYVTGLISVGSAVSSAVPVDAVVKSEGKEYIFIVIPSGHKEETHFKKVEVVSGVSELGYSSITPIEKLPGNTQIVTKGAFYLQSKSSGPSEHDH